jgi:hypothetical protein
MVHLCLPESGSSTLCFILTDYFLCITGHAALSCSLKDLFDGLCLIFNS